MYRQIRVHENDWPLQQILWREAQGDNPQTYQLCTVTYGLACAPYLALRCLHQLTSETDNSHALAAEILRRDTYVDDILSGAENISEAKEKISQLIDTLTAGGFTLKKWIANDSTLISDIPLNAQETLPTFSVKDQAMHHTLGLFWEHQHDQFVFSTSSLSNIGDRVTKRSVLSFIARMFDPLGWIAPIIITAKIFMQELWAIRLDWDEELPGELKSRWTNYVTQFENITSISIPRWTGLSDMNCAVEIHGFADASQNALAAVIYVRVLNDLNDVHVSLICAKTKVAPLKRIPRLELSAAVLLIRQVTKIRDVLELSQVPIHLWTDSSVALTWIKSHPSRWKEFVRNRVSFIQELSNSRWHHIAGKINPADLASRGTSPQRLPLEKLWWKGPTWLQNQSISWPSPGFTHAQTEETEECSPSCLTACEKQDPEIWDLIKNHSSLSSLLRITA